VTTRYERMKMQRRMQRRIQLVVEERRMSLGTAPRHSAEPVPDLETTVEIPLPPAAPAPVRAVGRMPMRTA
jgi:hypothetical protein